MKPYKIIKPTQPLWRNLHTIEVFVTHKRQIKLPLKLIMKCHPIPKDKHLAKTLLVKNYEQRSHPETDIPSP